MKHLKTYGSATLGALLLCLPSLLGLEGLSPAGQITMGIFLMAGLYWILEPIPIYATSLLIIFLQILLLSDQGFINFDPAVYEVESYQTFYGTLANPIIILFLSGFSLATAAVKFGLDRRLTRVLLKPLGTDPKAVCLGMMLSTALLSAFMSNTATTAMMMTMVVPVIMAMEPGDPFQKGIALSIPVAANIGGIATPIGSPPNAIAITALREQGIHITFSTWMILAVPLVIIMLLIAWRILLLLFPPNGKSIQIDFSEQFTWSRQAILTSCIFGITILFWVTEKLHGVSSNVVAFFPLTFLPALGILRKADIRRYSWEVLWLVAGGISMGISLKNTGLAEWLIGLIAWNSFGSVGVVLIFVVVAYGIANLVSNTVTATLLIPLAIGLGVSGIMGSDFPLVSAIVLIGIVVSFSMILPISTPPNAIATSTGMVKTKDMAKTGVLIGLIAIVLCCLSYFLYWPLILN